MRIREIEERKGKEGRKRRRNEGGGGGMNKERSKGEESKNRGQKVDWLGRES